MSYQFKAGAAKVCITPSEEFFPLYHKSNSIAKSGDYYFTQVHDDVYVRVLIMEAGETRSAIAVFDAPGIPYSVDDMYDIVSAAGNIPKTNIIVTCTHDHNNLFTDNLMFINGHGDEYREKMLKILEMQKQALKTAVETAVAALQPAKIGMDIGKSYLNVNRHVDLENGGFSIGGFEMDKPSDRDLAVIRIDALDGTPISILFNYAAHASCMTNCDATGTGTDITADIGLSCTYIENMWDNKPIAIFTSGAAGDQNMVMISRVYDVLPDGRTPMHDFDKPAGRIVLEFMSGLLARDVNKVAQGITKFHENTKIWCTKREIMAPAASFPDRGERAKDEPVELSLIMVGNFAIAASNGEIYTEIGMRMKQGAPFKNVMYITHAGSRLGYIRDVSGNGIVENIIKNNLWDMMDEYSHEA